MEISINNEGDKLIVKIIGNILGIVEASKIKDILNTYQDAKIIEFQIRDALAVPSSMIGLLIKKSLVEEKKVIIKVWHKELKELLYELNLQNYIEVIVEDGEFK